MIVIGVDVHEQSVTAAAADEAGRLMAEQTVEVGSEELRRVGGESRRGASVGARGLPPADALAGATAARSG